ncbi:MAG: hypothetical protein M3296_04130 [Actinomycetota bacterium]|nr:hypothetical protein [Actinomycetota bacterium]
MQLLVLAPEPVDADAVRAALGEEVEGARVLVVSPATNESPLAFWVSDSDEAIEEAVDAKDETVERLREEGVSASGTTGESEPLVALQDALATFPADRILIFVRAQDEQHYREDDVSGEAQRRFDVPVTLATLAG